MSLFPVSHQQREVAVFASSYHAWQVLTIILGELKLEILILLIERETHLIRKVDVHVDVEDLYDVIF